MLLSTFAIAMSMVYVAYASVAASGPLGLRRIWVLAVTAFLAAGALAGLRRFLNGRQQLAHALLTTSTWALLITLILDGAMFFGIIRIAVSRDIAVIPPHEFLITADGYKVAAHQRMWSAEVFAPGQVAASLPDAGFYERRRMRVVTDELGFRNAPGSTKRIQDVVLMGDSFVFGYGSDQETIWSRQLADLSGRTVYNLGLNGASPSEEVELLREVLHQGSLRLSARPAFVLLVFEGNDFSDGSAYVLRFDLLQRVKFAIGRWLDLSFFGQLATRLQWAFTPDRKDLAYRIAWSDRFGTVAFQNGYISQVTRQGTDEGFTATLFEKSGIRLALERLREEAERRSARAVVMYVPTKYRVYGESFRDLPAVPPADHAERLLAQACAQVGLQYLDLTPIFRRQAQSGEFLFWRDDTHLNDAGNRVLAQITYDLLR